MKQIRTIMSVLLMCTCLLSVCTVYGTDDEATTGALTPISKLQAIGIIKGDVDGQLHEERAVSRAEFVVMLMRLLQKHDDMAAMPQLRLFDDVPVTHWAAADIETAYDMGLISGYDDAHFAPDATVQYEEALKILLNAMGYEKQAKRKGGYPWGYMVLAGELGLASNGLSPGESLTRGETAELCYKGLYTPSADGEYWIYQYEKKPTEQQYYYISPLGRDTNPGTEDKPWKSLYKAAFTVKAGSTVIIEDGVYYEDRQTIVRNSGTEDAPIVFQARNPLKAKIVYKENMCLAEKFLVEAGIDYITLQGVEMTEEVMATEDDTNKTIDILYTCRGSHCRVIGNYFHHTYEEGIKFYLASDIVIADNIVTDTVHEAIDLVNCANVKIYNNDLSEFGRVGVFGKGGTRNMQIYNNYIHNKTKKGTIALSIGGSTDATFCYDVGEGTGYENYNSAYYNNIIHAEEKGLLQYALNIAAPKDAYIYNNVFINADVGYNVGSGGGISKGWPWWPDVVNVYVKNNIFYNCSQLAEEHVTPKNFVFENNLLYNTPGTAGNNIVADPMFVDVTSDWHLKEGSPAIGAGTPWPDFPALGGGTLDVERLDYDGEPYTEKWDIGVYSTH